LAASSRLATVAQDEQGIEIGGDGLVSGFVSAADKLIRGACASAGADRGVLFQRDRTDPRRMVVVAAVGPAADIIGQTFSSDRGLAGEAMTTGEPVTTEEYMRLPTRLVTEFPRPVHAACAVPLGEHGHTAAAISLGSSEPGRRFTDEDIERLRELSEQWEVERWTPRPRRSRWRRWLPVALVIVALGVWTVRLLTVEQRSSRAPANEQRFQLAGLSAGQAVNRCFSLRLPRAHGRVNVAVTARGDLTRYLTIRVDEGRPPPGPTDQSCRGFMPTQTLMQSTAGGRPALITYLQWPARGLRTYRIALAVQRDAGPDVSRRTAVVDVRAGPTAGPRPAGRLRTG
jgi:GAF domain